MVTPNFYINDGHQPRSTDTILTVTQKVLGAIIDGGSGGGAPVIGVNYQIVGGVLSLTNLDTGLHNPIYTFGANGAAGMQVNDGV